MGRHNFAARNVHAATTRLLTGNHIAAPPPWFNVIGSFPSSEVLTRKPLKRSTRSRKASRMFQPVHLEQPEDKLRWEFYNDHPWELARPRIVLENDGRDYTRWDWSHALCRPQVTTGEAVGKSAAEAWDQKQLTQASRPINGEAVVQRQQWLMQNENLSEAAAYDKARKEFYRTRHMQEVEQRVAREEAMFYGAILGKGALEIGMHLEDAAFEDFRKYAERKMLQKRQSAEAANTGNMNEEDAESTSTAESEEQ